MARLQFTTQAEEDLSSIASHTLETWGMQQAIRYLADLEACCARLVDDRTAGRVHRPRPEYWRIEQGRHVVFFRRKRNGDVTVVRVLHDRMLPALHLGGKPEE